MCTHMFICRDAIHTPLQPPYNGPFKVISRSTKSFKVDLGMCTDTVSIDRLKPAHLDKDTMLPQPTPPEEPAAETTAEPQVQQTRSGQHVRFPEHYMAIVHC